MPRLATHWGRSIRNPPAVGFKGSGAASQGDQISAIHRIDQEYYKSANWKHDFCTALYNVMNSLYRIGCRELFYVWILARFTNGPARRLSSMRIDESQSTTCMPCSVLFFAHRAFIVKRKKCVQLNFSLPACFFYPNDSDLSVPSSGPGSSLAACPSQFPSLWPLHITNARDSDSRVGVCIRLLR